MTEIAQSGERQAPRKLVHPYRFLSLRYSAVCARARLSLGLQKNDGFPRSSARRRFSFLAKTLDEKLTY